MKPIASGLLAASLLLAATPAQAMLFERADLHQGQVILGFGGNEDSGLMLGGSVGVTPSLSLGAVFSQKTGPSVAGTWKLGETAFGLSYGVTLGYFTRGLSTPDATTGLRELRYAGVGIPFAARLGGKESPFILRGDLMRFFYPIAGGSPDMDWMPTEIAYRWGAFELKTGTRSPIGIRVIF